MTSTPTAPKATFLNLLLVTLHKIARAERGYIDRAEEHVRAYAEGLADANILTDAERDEWGRCCNCDGQSDPLLQLR